MPFICVERKEIYEYSSELISNHVVFRLLVCLFGFFRPTTIFHSFGDVIITDEVLKFSPILGIHCHWAVTVLNVQHVLWHGLTLYLFFVLFGVLRPTREFFTHKETSPLPVNGFKFWSTLGTRGNWAVRVL